MEAGLSGARTGAAVDKLVAEVLRDSMFMSTPGRFNSSKKRTGQGNPGGALSPSDAELVVRIRDGDMQACQIVVERYQRLLYSIAYGMVGDHFEASDVIQQVFIRFFEKADKVRKPKALKTYLARSTTNESIDRLRKVKRRRTISLDEIKAQEILPLEDGRTPEQHVRRLELAELIRWAISKLSKTQQKVVVLSFIEGLTYTEIAQILDCEEVTVRTHLHRARKRLQEILGPRLSDLEAGFGRED